MRPSRLTALTIFSTLLLLVDYYHRLTPSKSLDRALLYFFVPLGIILLLWRESPCAYGFRLGNWRLGLGYSLGAMVLLTPLVWALTRLDSSLRGYYAPLASGSLPLPLFTFLELIGWEFFFRGWLLFGYAPRFGPAALWLQAVPFALAHISKPEVETLSTLFGGAAFGWLAWRSGSFLYPFLVHWYLLSLTIFFSTL